MWKKMIFYFPEWTVFLQGFIAFLVPYGIAKIYKWICTAKEENEMADIKDETKLRS